MENFEQRENREKEIDALIENLAQVEGMSVEDIFLDIITFAELCQQDEDAKGYFEELAEKLNLPVDEVIEYAIKKLD